MSVDTAADEIRETIRRLVADILELEPSEIADDADVSEAFAADSLQHLELVNALEREYGVRFGADDWRGPTTVSALTARTIGRIRAR